MESGSLHTRVACVATTRPCGPRARAEMRPSVGKSVHWACCNLGALEVDLNLASHQGIGLFNKDVHTALRSGHPVVLKVE